MTTLPLSRSGKEAIDVASAAARQAGDILKARFREETQVRFKGRANIVTDVDLSADDSIKSLLQEEYPDHNIVSEETEPIKGDSDYTWILDPLDGTNNYSFGVPFFSTVIALTVGDDVQLGIVYDPLRDELFSAQKGAGTFLNKHRVSVSNKTKVQDSLTGLDLGYVEENGRKMLAFLAELWPNVYAIRAMGSAALGMAYTSCGWLDLYFHLLLYPWEMACGQLLVTEAGGVATNWEGESLGAGQDSVIASSGAVHADFMRILREMAR